MSWAQRSARPRHGEQAVVAPYQNWKERRFILVGSAWWNEKLGEGAQDNSAFQRKVPVFQILDVARNAVLDVRTVSRFSAKAAHLGQSSDAGFDERADVI